MLPWTLFHLQLGFVQVREALERLDMQKYL